MTDEEWVNWGALDDDARYAQLQKGFGLDARPKEYPRPKERPYIVGRSFTRSVFFAPYETRSAGFLLSDYLLLFSFDAGYDDGRYLGRKMGA